MLNPDCQKTIARQMASLLAENEATVSDLPEVFAKVRANLQVSLTPVPMPSGYLFGTWPPPRTDPPLTEDGDWEWNK